MTRKSPQEKNVSSLRSCESAIQAPQPVKTLRRDSRRVVSAATGEILDETLDTFLNGRLKLYQSRQGYRLALDTLLLAFFASVNEGDRVMDLGTGNGTLALILASLYPSLSVVGLEIQSEMAVRAVRNVHVNGHEKNVSVIAGDVRVIEEVAPAGSFDRVVANPPYRSPHTGRVSPYPEKTVARHEIHGTLADFVKAAAYLLPAKGRFAVIYRAARTGDLVQAMRGACLEPKRLRMVHATARSAASLVLAEGVKGGRNEMQVLPPLIVFDEKRSYTAEVTAMLEGKRS